MLDVSSIAEGFFDPIVRVVDQMLEHAPVLEPDRVMLVGAWCRDTLHAALGHDFETRATRDVDIALALSGWDVYEQLARLFPAASDTGLAFRIAEMVADLIPFGELEDPVGEVHPPKGDDTISVWAFTEIFDRARPLSLTPSLAIRCPTVPGLRRREAGRLAGSTAWGEPKDANDIALTVHWYAESSEVQDRLYESPQGSDMLLAEEVDVPRAAARLLGADVADLIGPDRLAELLERWPGNIEMLARNFVIPAATHVPQESRRLELIQALTRGLAEPSSPTPS